METIRSLSYSFYLIFHPFDGYNGLKYGKKGKLGAAMLILLALALTFIIKRQLTGFIFNMADLTKLNVLNEFMRVLVPFILWCIANWCITTLMEGEGSFSEIVTATANALVPLVILYIPLTVFSNMLTVEEGAFYYFFDVFPWYGQPG